MTIGQADPGYLVSPRICTEVFDQYRQRWLALTTPLGAVNFLVLETTPTAAGIILGVDGTGPDYDISLDPKGAGVVRLLGPVTVTGDFIAEANVTLNNTSGVTLVKGATTVDDTLEVTGATDLDTTLNVGGATTLRAALTQSGGTASLNVTGTSSTLIGNSTGTLTVASGGASGWTNTNGALMLRTLTSGAIVVNSVGALTVTAGAASTVTLPSVVNALSFQTNLLSLDTTNSFVGIGTAAPSCILDITQSSPISTTAMLTNTTTGANAQTQFRAVNAAGDFAYEGMTSKDFNGLTVINGDGNHGVGFWLSNGARWAALGCQDLKPIHFVQNNTVVALFDTSGRFGINQPTPAEKLDIIGNVLVTGTSGNIHRVVGSANSSIGSTLKNNTNGTAAAAQFQVINNTGHTASEGVTDSAYNSFTVLNGGVAFWLSNGMPAVFGAQSDHAIEFVINNAFIAELNTAGSFKLFTAASRLIPGAQSFTIRNHADDKVGLTITDAGAVTIGDSTTPRGSLAVPNMSRARVYANTNQSLTSGAFRIIQFDTEVKDQLGEFDNATNYRFTPSATGIYVVKVCCSFQAVTAGHRIVGAIHVAGSRHTDVFDWTNTSAATAVTATFAGGGVFDLTATTDFVDFRVFPVTGNETLDGAHTYTNVIQVARIG